MSRARLHDLASEIGEIRRAIPSTPCDSHGTSSGRSFSVPDDEAVPSTMPTGGWSRLASVLTEMAVHQVVVRELDAARRTANDALLLIDMIDEEGTRAGLSLTLGEVLLEVFEAHRARERFEAAIVVFDGCRDLSCAARARVGLARAMASLRDPVARAVLEDAGTAFEELGDEQAVRAIDLELREIAAEFDESPTSFQAITPRRGSR